MAYEYTLTNEGQFKAKKFQETTDIQLKNNGTVECNEIVESLEFKEVPTRGTFLKIYYHCPQSITDYWNGRNILTTSYYDFNKFSLINILDDSFRDEEGEFEFLLEFPSGTVGGTDVGTYGQLWKQLANPKSPYIDEDSFGYKNSSGNITGKNNWGGFALSTSSGSCTIDGNPGISNWFYPLGQITEWKGGIPGPFNDNAFKDIKLWVKLPTSKLKEKGSFYLGADNKIYCNEFIEESNNGST